MHCYLCNRMNLKIAFQLLQNMGLRYVIYRVIHEFKKRTGILRKKFPVKPTKQLYRTLDDWRNNTPLFFIQSRNAIKLAKNKSKKLENNALRILGGEIQFFQADWKMLGLGYDWLSNPESGHVYSLDHWSKIPDFNPNVGDIKYVWEKSRFSYLQTIMRYDYHFEEDHAEWVFSEIDSWIASNPINQGPNWVCSQETSLRLLNWCYAFYFYKDSSSLTEERWSSYLNVIYWKLHHVYHHINFSRIAVRNNHAITETLMLHIGGRLFPDFDNAKFWSEKGKKWFEEEVAYQIFEDGTYLQFSHNYHRVVVQLLTLGIRFSELHNDSYKDHVYKKAEKSVDFLYQQMSLENGELPNYGSNDGALFFNFSDSSYRDFRPQLNALNYCIHKKHLFAEYQDLEDVYWYYSDVAEVVSQKPQEAITSYSNGGFYGLRDTDSSTAIRCGNHENRPAQADNLHLDIWIKGNNIFRDAGTYKYNTDQQISKFFFGTRSHNTVMLGEYDQMLKGDRFIWFNWSQACFARVQEHDDHFSFEGKIRAFQYLDRSITHTRKVRKYKNSLKWEVDDDVYHNTDLPINQIWNIHPDFVDKVKIKSKDNDGELIAQSFDGWYSSSYGRKEHTEQLIFSTNKKSITTEITIDF